MLLGCYISDIMKKGSEKEKWAMKKGNEKEKWAWATPEKLNPKAEKHARQGALLLIIMGAVLFALGLFIVIKFKVYSFSEFTGMEDTYRNRDQYSVIITLFSAPMLLGAFMILGGLGFLFNKRFTKKFPFGE